VIRVNNPTVVVGIGRARSPAFPLAHARARLVYSPPEMSRQLVSVAIASLVAVAHAAPADDARFDAMVDDYYAGWAAANPTAATDLGIHAHDGDLEDYSPPAIAREVSRLQKAQRDFAALDEKKLDPARAIDLLILRGSIRAALLKLTDEQQYRHRADLYPEQASETIDVIMKRDFAPLADRLRSAIAREEKIPPLLTVGQQNLAEVPPVAVAMALDELLGIQSFFEHDVPAAFAPVKDPRLEAHFKSANKAVLAALESYGKFLKALQPKAHGSFVLGEARFRAKLAAEEMIDIPLDELERRGEAELRRLQNDFRATAAKIDPKKEFRAVQAELINDHPRGGELLGETRARLDGLRRFLVEKRIVSVPSEVMPKVVETPPFMRASTIASMSTPGPFEAHANEAFFNVTLPEAGWPPERAEEFLRGAFNRPLLDVLVIHEAFPGHYVQFLWVPRIHSKVRKMENVTSESEGWAHYCEQMILDEGYRAGDAKVRLMQLQDALLRAARYLVGIRMHARGMSFDDAVTFFEREGYQTHPVATVEARRGTRNPTYLVYTWGKLEILRLRDDYKKKMGAGYSLQKFHDALLAEGPIPIPLLRKALLGESEKEKRP
jgi:uncharacterized protein (DUF885 family)